MDGFEEYKLFFEHVHDLTQRRQNITTIFLSVNAAVITALTLSVSINPVTPYLKYMLAVGVMLSGIIACDLWRRLIAQYSTLLSWWYAKLRDIEAHLPGSHKLLTQEFSDLYTSKKGKGHVGLTRYETTLTWLFTAIYIVSICVIAAVLIFAFIQKTPVY